MNALEKTDDVVSKDDGEMDEVVPKKTSTPVKKSPKAKIKTARQKAEEKQVHLSDIEADNKQADEMDDSKKLNTEDEANTSYGPETIVTGTVNFVTYRRSFDPCDLDL